MSIFDKLKNTAASAVGSAVQSAVQSVGNKRETFTFAALPESLAEMQALPEADLGDPYKTAALTVCALCVYAADKDIAQRYGYDWDHDGGVLVMKVASRSPVSLTDIRPGDYILAIDGQSIDTVKGMRDILDTHKPGDRIKVTYEHNGRKADTEVLLASAPESNQ